jgi:hypothetical protein
LEEAVQGIPVQVGEGLHLNLHCVQGLTHIN